MTGNNTKKATETDYHQVCADLEQRIAAARDEATQAEQDRRALALDAETGDKAAADKLAEASRRATDAAVKLDNLAYALEQAKARAAEQDAAQQAQRNRQRAAQVRDLQQMRAEKAQQIDVKLVEIAGLMEELASLGREINALAPDAHRPVGGDVRKSLRRACVYHGLPLGEGIPRRHAAPFADTDAAFTETAVGGLLMRFEGTDQDREAAA